MEATRRDILDLVAVTVGNLRSGGTSDYDVAYDVVLDAEHDDIYIAGKPLAISRIRACTHSCQKFVDLIKGAMG